MLELVDAVRSMHVDDLLLWNLQAFLILVAMIVLRHAKTLLGDSRGWKHRWCGCLYLALLVYTAVWNLPEQKKQYIRLSSFQPKGSARAGDRWTSASLNDDAFDDIILPCLGLITTLTAARDFPHEHVMTHYATNAPGQSGALSAKAVITQAEMIEHAFYQALNIWQALYLRSLFALYRLSTNLSFNVSLLALGCVTAPWFIRRRVFPVNSFSDNWLKTPPERRTVAETRLYQIKKIQYLFYKHVVCHGINITVCLFPDQRLSMMRGISWRFFWLCLNTAYAMEFFLQSLVKRRILSQSTMLNLNRWLILISSGAAGRAVVPIVSWPIAAMSCTLNLLHRYHDVTNTMLLAVTCYLFMMAYS